MSSVSFSIAGNPFHNKISEGLSTLLQNQELVDMTLSADGHFIKVHQLVMALASPYLQQLIASAPCQHPVIFLNNVSSENLRLLLEYIYTGEAIVPEDCMKQFINFGKSLHVRGLEDLSFKQNVDKTMNSPKVEKVESNPIKRVEHTYLDSGHSIKKLAISRGSELQQVTVPALAKNVKVGAIQTTNPMPPLSTNSITDTCTPVKTSEQHNLEDDDDGKDSSMTDMTEKSFENQSDQSITAKDNSTVQFTISKRGCLQVILNRYIYNFMSHKRTSGVRRWRCIDYRERKCLAFVTTQGNMVLSRGNMHNHAFHDRKILQKITKNCVFSAIDEAERFVAEEVKEGQENNQ